MYANADLHGKGASAEDSMKWQVISPLSKDRYDQSLYQEAARRVVFRNCMSKCELDDEKLPNFNKNFWYNMPEAQACLSDCVNTRMVLHFGCDNARKYDLMMDFDEMRNEFRNYEKWLPQQRIRDQYAKGLEEEKVEQLIGKLAAKSTRGRFDFN